MNAEPSIWDWQLTISPFKYLLLCIVGTVALRLISSVFRAWAVQRGDFPDSITEPGKSWSFRRAFWECFKGFGKSKAHADFWTNALIGFAELAAYPVLLKMESLTVIGAWLALRTAFSWSGWSISRTSFNRFILINVLELAIAYFGLSRFVQVRGIPALIFRPRP